MIKLPPIMDYREAEKHVISPKNKEWFAQGANWMRAEVQRLNTTAQPVSDEHARIADALESLLWPNMAIGNKDIILCAIKALRGKPAAPGGQDS